MKRFFRPTTLKLVVVALCFVVAVGGLIQASDFTPNKSPLLPLLRPFPLWVAFVYLIAPLATILVPFQALGMGLLAGPPWFVVLVTVVYFYVLSCLIDAIVRAVRWLFARLTRSV